MTKISIACYTLLLAACSTGIDSTPKITVNDVKREVGTLTPEQQLLADILPEPFEQWKPGKQFYVNDDRIKLMLGATAPAYDLAGTYITFDRAQEETSPFGEKMTRFTFTTQQGDKIVYQSSLSPAELARRQRVEIPFAIEKSLIDSTRQRLAGRRLYTLVADRFTPAGDNSRRAKYIPVTVKSVEPGNDLFPIALILDEQPGESMVYMSVGGGNINAGRSFASLFALDDPHKHYPAIKDNVWALIVNNKVAEGMTLEECRLALGAPQEVNRYNTGSYLREIWTYENGVFLRFEDGVLKQFSK